MIFYQQKDSYHDQCQCPCGFIFNFRNFLMLFLSSSSRNYSFSSSGSDDLSLSTSNTFFKLSYSRTSPLSFEKLALLFLVAPYPCNFWLKPLKDGGRMAGKETDCWREAGFFLELTLRRVFRSLCFFRVLSWFSILSRMLAKRGVMSYPSLYFSKFLFFLFTFMILNYFLTLSGSLGEFSLLWLSILSFSYFFYLSFSSFSCYIFWARLCFSRAFSKYFLASLASYAIFSYSSMWA